jgi:2-polyprenyl-3-methyl-5-hydroxy-6-metoxy-1,4-benzoquinol methylase
MPLETQYNDWHQQVFDSSPEHRDEESPWYKLVLEYLVPLAGKRVLEVACGRGGFAKLLASQGACTFGADFSYTALEIAQKRAHSNGAGSSQVHFAEADAQNLPYASNSFDVVVSCETIEHLPDPLSALQEMARVCRPGGLLYLTTPNYFNAMGLYNIYARIRHRRATPGSDQPYDRVFLFPEVRRMLRRTGWEIVDSDGTVHQFPVWPGHDPVGLPALESNRILRRMLSPLAFHYFMLARRSHAQ